jgi:small subunit ribosomal protein S10
MDLLKINKLRIALKGYESNLLNDSCEQILTVSKNGNTRAVGPIPLPTKRRIYCVLRSPHVNKDSREHFEIRVHKRIIDLYQPSEETLTALRNLDLSAGIDVEIKSV